MEESEADADAPDEYGSPTPTPPAETPQSGQTAFLLSDDDFEPEWPQKPPGPGIPESLLWVFGLVMLQIAGGVFGLLLAVVSEASKVGSQELLRSLQNPEQQQQFVEQLLKGSPVALFCGVQSVFLLGAVFAAALRLGRNRRLSLPLRAFPIPHWVIIGLLIVPLMLFGEALFRYALEYWEMFVSHFPLLKGLSKSSSMDQIALLVPKASLALLLFLIAFVPAVAEELVFRGVIGRGLVARWGLPVGVLMTSLLFAAVHVHPVHAFALMPLAVCIHLAYLSTHSFWAPMAMHFVNNGCAVVALKLMPGNAEMIEPAGSGEPSLYVFVSAALCIVTLTALLWQMRVQFIRPDGSSWNPGYRGADIPPSQMVVTEQYARPDWRLLAACGISGLSFVAALVFTSVETAAEAV